MQHRAHCGEYVQARRPCAHRRSQSTWAS